MTYNKMKQAYKKITLDTYFLDMLLYTPTRWLIGTCRKGGATITRSKTFKYACALFFKQPAKVYKFRGKR